MKPTPRALAIGAHPDDVEVGCGGTLAGLARAGWHCTIIIVTNGNKGSHDPARSPHLLAATREEEQRAAAARLGVQQVLFLRYNDGELAYTPALRMEMALYIRHLQPQRVFTHDPWRMYMLHPDHRAVGFAVLDGIVSARDHLYLPGFTQLGIGAWRPDTLDLWMAEQPNHTEDISDTLETKFAALDAHASQMQAGREWVQRMRQRALEAGQAAGYPAGEAFRRIAL